jgi:hypothetical protein
MTEEKIITMNAVPNYETGGWYTADSTLVGVNVSAQSLDGLLKKLPGVVQDILKKESNADQKPVRLQLIVNIDIIPRQLDTK